MAAAQAVSRQPDISIGVKVRLHKKAMGENSRAALRLAIKAGEATHTPIMVHVGNTAIGMDEIAATLASRRYHYALLHAAEAVDYR